MVYQLFGQATAHLGRHGVGEQTFPVQSRRVYYLPPEVFARERLGFAPVTTGSLALLLNVLSLVTLRRFVRRVQSPISRSLPRLQAALANPSDL